MNFGTPAWTIHNSSGEEVIAFTSFISLDFRADGKVVSAPVEEGSFATYNKTESPLEFDIQLGIEGSDSDLQSALDAISKLKSGIELLSLVTPNAVYESLNLESYSYAIKRENGVGVLWVDLSFVEVKQVRAEYSNEKLATRKDSGKKQVKKANSGGENAEKEKKRSMLFSGKKALFG